jgi:hypothetical protein
MNKKEKFDFAIEQGFRYDEKTGNVYTPKNKLLINTNAMGYTYLNPYHNGKTFIILSHQFAWYYKYNQLVDCIDHINQDKTDNRINNLRSVTKQENQWNQTKKGYTFFKRDNNWKAQIHLNRKTIHLGYYDTEDKAHQAYIEAKKIYHNIKNNINK